MTPQHPRRPTLKSLAGWLVGPCLGLSLGCFQAGETPALPSVVYELKAGETPSSLSIMLDLPPEPEGRVRLALLPDRFGAATGLAEAVEWGETRNADLEVSEDGSRAELIFRDPSKRAQLYYQLKPLYEGPPHDRLRVFWPAIQPDYWYFSPTTALVAPDRSDPFFVTLRLKTPTGSRGWNLASPVGVETDCSEECSTTFRVESAGALHADVSQALIFVFGQTTLRTASLFNEDEQRRNELDISIYGLPDYVESENTLVEAVVEIVRSHQIFWQDRGHPRFVISLIAFENHEPNNFGGFNARGLFTSFVPRHARVEEWTRTDQTLPQTDWPGLLSHISHEYGHTWIRPDLVDASQEKPEDFGWLLEGVTEYRADQALLQAHLINMKEYAERLNLKLGRYDGAFRNARDKSLEEIRAGFWTGDYGLQRQPYLRGNLLAHNWNASISKASKARTNFNALLKRWVAASRPQGLGSPRIEEIAYEFLDTGVMGDVKRHWLQGQVIELDEDALGPCFTLGEEDGTRQFQRRPDVTDAQWDQACPDPPAGWSVSPAKNHR